MFPERASKLSKSGQCDSHHCTRERQEWLVRELCHTYLPSGARLHLSKGYRQSGGLTTWTCCWWWFDGDLCRWCNAACPTWRPYVVLNFTIWSWMIEGCGLSQTSSWHSRKRGKHLEVNMIIPIWSGMTKLLSASRMRAYVPLKWSIPWKWGDFAGKRWRRFAGLPWEYVLFLTRIFLPDEMFH